MFCVPQNSPATRALASPRVARVASGSRCSPSSVLSPTGFHESQWISPAPGFPSVSSH
jgi:hypothetical protein